MWLAEARRRHEADTFDINKRSSQALAYRYNRPDVVIPVSVLKEDILGVKNVLMLHEAHIKYLKASGEGSAGLRPDAGIRQAAGSDDNWCDFLVAQDVLGSGSGLIHSLNVCESPVLALSVIRIVQRVLFGRPYDQVC